MKGQVKGQAIDSGFPRMGARAPEGTFPQPLGRTFGNSGASRPKREAGRPASAPPPPESMYEITIRVDDPALASRLASMVVRSDCYSGIRGVRVALVHEDREEATEVGSETSVGESDEGPRGILRPFRS